VQMCQGSTKDLESMRHKVAVDWIGSITDTAAMGRAET